jgi:ribose transport system substrate-binding protein
VAALAGCGGKEPGGGGEKQGFTIAVIPKCTGGEFWETVERGARKAAAEFAVDMKWEGTLTETQIAEQNKIIDNMVNLDVDGICLAPLNPRAMQKTVENAVEAGIPVVIFDSAVDGTAHVSFVATDNTGGGALGARHMIELLGEKKGKVAVMRFVHGTASTEARAAGFIETAKAAGIEIAADPVAEDGTVAGSKKTALNTLEGFIRDGKLALDGIFCCNDRSTLGTLAAVEDIRKSGVEVTCAFIGFDFPPKAVQALVDGTIDALVVQDPLRMGYLAVETMVKHLRTESVEKFVDTGARLATRTALEKDATLRQLVGVKDL